MVKGELKNQEWVAPTINTSADGSLYVNIVDLAKWDAALYTEQLLKRGRSDPKVREYIARHLPPMIEKGPADKDHPGPWIELVRLAGGSRSRKQLPP